MDNKELIELDLTWEQLEEQEEANKRKAEAAKFKFKIRKYI